MIASEPVDLFSTKLTFDKFFFFKPRIRTGNKNARHGFDYSIFLS